MNCFWCQYARPFVVLRGGEEPLRRLKACLMDSKLGWMKDGYLHATFIGWMVIGGFEFQAIQIRAWRTRVSVRSIARAAIARGPRIGKGLGYLVRSIRVYPEGTWNK